MFRPRSRSCVLKALAKRLYWPLVLPLAMPKPFPGG